MDSSQAVENCCPCCTFICVCLYWAAFYSSTSFCQPGVSSPTSEVGRTDVSAAVAWFSRVWLPASQTHPKPVSHNDRPAALQIESSNPADSWRGTKQNGLHLQRTWSGWFSVAPQMDKHAQYVLFYSLCNPIHRSSLSLCSLAFSRHWTNYEGNFMCSIKGEERDTTIWES